MAKLISDINFWSYQFVELSNTTIQERKRYKFWWWALRKGFLGMAPEMFEAAIKLAMEASDNTKTEDELRKIIQEFLKEVNYDVPEA